MFVFVDMNVCAGVVVYMQHPPHQHQPLEVIFQYMEDIVAEDQEVVMEEEGMGDMEEAMEVDLDAAL